MVVGEMDAPDDLGCVSISSQGKLLEQRWAWVHFS